MHVLDTNVISEARKSRCDARVRNWLAAQEVADLYLSAITVLEVQRGITQARCRGDARQAAVIEKWLDDHVLPAFDGRILPVDGQVARRAGRLDWPDSRDYRDALIAATALEHGAAVATRNVRHFEALGVRLVNPWDAGTV